MPFGVQGTLNPGHCWKPREDRENNELNAPLNAEATSFMWKLELGLNCRRNPGMSGPEVRGA